MEDGVRKKNMKKLLIAFITTLPLSLTAMGAEQAAAAPVDEIARLSIQPTGKAKEYTNVADYLRMRETRGPHRATQWAKPTCIKRMFAQPRYSTYVGDRVVFSPNGTMIATAVGNNAQLWDLHGNCLATLAGHVRWIDHVAFCPDGTTLATASCDKTTRLWNLQGDCLATLRGHTDYISHVAFSPDGTTLATALQDGTAKLWNLQGNCLATLMGHTKWIRYLAFSPDGTTLATASCDKTTRLWNLQGNCLTTLRGHTGSVTCLAFSPAGTTLATASDDRTTRLWDLNPLHYLCKPAEQS